MKRNDVTFGFLLMIKPPYKFYEYFKYILHQSSKNKSLSLNSLTYLSRSIAPLGRQVICLLKRKITAGNNISWSMTFKKKSSFYKHLSWDFPQKTSVLKSNDFKLRSSKAITYYPVSLFQVQFPTRVSIHGLLGLNKFF